MLRSSHCTTRLTLPLSLPLSLPHGRCASTGATSAPRRARRPLGRLRPRRRLPPWPACGEAMSRARGGGGDGNVAKRLHAAWRALVGRAAKAELPEAVCAEREEAAVVRHDEREVAAARDGAWRNGGQRLDPGGEDAAAVSGGRDGRGMAWRLHSQLPLPPVAKRVHTAVRRGGEGMRSARGDHRDSLTERHSRRRRSVPLVAEPEPSCLTAPKGKQPAAAQHRQAVRPPARSGRHLPARLVTRKRDLRRGEAPRRAGSSRRATRAVRSPAARVVPSAELAVLVGAEGEEVAVAAHDQRVEGARRDRCGADRGEAVDAARREDVGSGAVAECAAPPPAKGIDGPGGGQGEGMLLAACDRVHAGALVAGRRF
mmetsp:Transcript_35370/g.118257  ORF Transcript_35370/g.118257 Transcript_35370/m.118257 type:complete len:371 (+) Transcript_35370:559-1671(+)